MSKFYSGKPDYFEAIGDGRVPNKSVVSKFGRVVASTTEQIVWDGGNGYEFLSDEQFINIVSSSAEDVNGGVGAWLIKIFGLDINHEPITEEVTLNGLTPVQTVNKYHRLNRMYVVKDGNGLATEGSNTGTITATTVTTTDLQAQIQPHEGQTLMCIFTIPSGYKGLLWAEADSCGRLRECTFRLKWRNAPEEDNGSFSTKSIRDLYELAWQKEKKIPIEIGEAVDIVITVVSTQSVTASASFDLVLVKLPE